ncbi:MAG: MBL fold metallo-hydrolase [Desulfurococcales archaeon]|nr:MBL fold metallo-hydrolase [Desulfurococcales archaeon]
MIRDSYPVIIIDVTPRDYGRELIASYLVIGSEKTALIETGPASSSETLISRLDELGIEPDYIVVTHIHLDHGGAAGQLAKRYPQAKIIVHPRGYKHLANPAKLWQASQQVLGEVAILYGEPIPVPEKQLHPAEDGEIIELGGDQRLYIQHTPGHASHHMSILFEPHRLLFTGDAAGVSFLVDGMRIRLPTTPPPFKPELYIESLEKMKKLNPSKIVPTHYGIDPLPGTEYLDRHKHQLEKWLGAVQKLVEKGVSDPSQVAEKLPEYLDEARDVVEKGGKIAYVSFYYSTVWGMVDYFVRGKQ